ncbi:MAG TPA: GGDEF domain-containing protein [Pseudonocardiaceae bacterium]|nr:GGDEF domain-containing protein [Pseudonocardiaceae bacterium]
MGTREVSPRRWHDHRGETLRALRTRWRTASLAAGWPFPNDWPLAEIDVVCRAVLDGDELAPVLSRLGRARAEAGAGLGETLCDLAALHAVVNGPGGADGIVSPDPDATPAPLIRVTALAWADVVLEQLAHTEVSDGLTGLSSPAYLRARLREIYRETAAEGVAASDKYVLVLLSPDVSRTSGWSRLAALVLLADSLRAVYDGGQTLAAIGPATLGVLAERDGRCAARLAELRWSAAARLSVDPQLAAIGPPPVWLEQLPPTHEAACRLLADLAKN